MIFFNGIKTNHDKDIQHARKRLTRKKYPKVALKASILCKKSDIYKVKLLYI